jgi:hypothetical protein
MAMYYILYALGAFGATLTFVQDKKWGPAQRKVYLPIFLGSLLILAAFRSSSTDRDYLNYLGWFDLIAQGGLSWTDWIKDPAFVLISQLVLKIGLRSYVGVLFVFVALALIGKVYFLRMATSERWLLLALYLMLCRFFLAQEMNAIRAAVAIPLISISVLLAFRRKIKPAVGVYLLAVTFHLSALVLLPVLILLLLGVRFQSSWWTLPLIPAAVVGYIGISYLLGSSVGFLRLDVYLNDPDIVQVNVFLSVYFWERIFILAVVFIGLWKVLSAEDRLVFFLCAAGTSAQAALAFNGTLAFRTADLFGLFDLLLFLVPLKYLERRAALGYLIFLIVIGLAVFGSQTRLMQPFSWIFL